MGHAGCERQMGQDDEGEVIVRCDNDRLTRGAGIFRVYTITILTICIYAAAHLWRRKCVRSPGANCVI